MMRNQPILLHSYEVYWYSRGRKVQLEFKICYCIMPMTMSLNFDFAQYDYMYFREYNYSNQILYIPQPQKSQLVKSFTPFGFLGEFADFFLALGFLSIITYKTRVKSAAFKISYLKQRKLILMNTFRVQGIFIMQAQSVRQDQISGHCS